MGHEIILLAPLRAATSSCYEPNPLTGGSGGLGMLDEMGQSPAFGPKGAGVALSLCSFKTVFRISQVPFSSTVRRTPEHEVALSPKRR